MLDKALGLLDHHLRDLDVARRRLVESARDDFAADHAAHVGHFLWPLVDQQDDQYDVGAVGSDGVGDVLQHQGLAGFRRRDDQGPLTLADRCDQVDDPRRQVLGCTVAAFQRQSFVGEVRGEVLEEDFLLLGIRLAEVDLVDLEQREITFATTLGRPDLAGDAVACAQVEASDLVLRYVDVVRPGKVRAVGRAQETESVGQDFEGSFAVYVVAVRGLLAQDGSDDLVLARSRQVVEAHAAGHFDEFADGFAFQVCEVHGGSFSASGGWSIGRGARRRALILGVWVGNGCVRACRGR